MREKSPLPSTIKKYTEFLECVMENALPYDCKVQLTEIVTNFAINKTIIKALTHFEIIKIKDKTSWIWNQGDPNKNMVLEILDFLLHLNKKTIHTPIVPEWATIAAHIKEIRDCMINASPKATVSIEGLKTPLLSRALNQVEQKPCTTLFSETDNKEAKKFELLKSIAGPVHSVWSNNGDSIETINDYIIEATEYLYNKFFKVK